MWTSLAVIGAGADKHTPFIYKKHFCPFLPFLSVLNFWRVRVSKYFGVYFRVLHVFLRKMYFIRNKYIRNLLSTLIFTTQMDGTFSQMMMDTRFFIRKTFIKKKQPGKRQNAKKT